MKDTTSDQFVLLIIVIGCCLLALIAFMYLSEYGGNPVERQAEYDARQIDARIKACMALEYSRDECIILIGNN